MFKKVLLIIIILIVVIYLFMINKSEKFTNGNDSNIATYNVQFVTMWGDDPTINHPDNPHTGNMFLLNHNNNFKLFEVGEFASKGVSNTSMYGTIDNLFVMTNDNPNIGNVTKSGVLMAPGETDLMINVTSDKPLISFVTMIAPSSDWFTGFSLNLLDNNHIWTTKQMIPLYVYVAGTDSNQGFVTEHKLKMAPDRISVKNDSYLFKDGKLKPIAYAIVTKV